MIHRRSRLGFAALAVVTMSILASCTSGSVGNATGAGAGTDAATDLVQPPAFVADTAASRQAALPAGQAAVVPASYAVGHLSLSLLRMPGTFSSPVLVTNAKDGTGRLFVVEQGGRIKIIDAGVALATPFLDIHTKVSCCDERGLLGLAFHPSYKTNGRFFIDYTDTSGNTVIAEYHRDPANPNKALAAGTTILHIAQPYANHNGGMLAFGPDGYLYIGMGDGGSAGDPGNRAQRLTYLLGKILRIDINHSSGTLHYRSPSTNPYVGKTGDDRIWAYGLRNPWRFSFDRATGDLWIGDVGQNRYEEIDRATHSSGGGRAKNYGWHVLEGRACYNPASGCSSAGKTHPIAVYTHSLGCAVVGGYVYRGTLFGAMRGAYIFGDYCSGRIWALKANGASSQTPSLLRSSGLSISSFGEGENGEMYLTDLGGGVYRVQGTAK